MLHLPLEKSQEACVNRQRDIHTCLKLISIMKFHLIRFQRQCHAFRIVSLSLFEYIMRMKVKTNSYWPARFVQHSNNLELMEEICTIYVEKSIHVFDMLIKCLFGENEKIQLHCCALQRNRINFPIW